jgi:hypothetical protein
MQEENERDRPGWSELPEEHLDLPVHKLKRQGLRPEQTPGPEDEEDLVGKQTGSGERQGNAEADEPD